MTTEYDNEFPFDIDDSDIATIANAISDDNELLLVEMNRAQARIEGQRLADKFGSHFLHSFRDDDDNEHFAPLSKQDYDRNPEHHWSKNLTDVIHPKPKDATIPAKG